MNAPDDASPPQPPRTSRIDKMAHAARIIERGCRESRYSDRKLHRLLWETAFHIFADAHACFVPALKGI